MRLAFHVKTYILPISVDISFHKFYISSYIAACSHNFSRKARQTSVKMIFPWSNIAYPWPELLHYYSVYRISVHVRFVARFTFYLNLGKLTTKNDLLSHDWRIQQYDLRLHPVLETDVYNMHKVYVHIIVKQQQTKMLHRSKIYLSFWSIVVPSQT